MRVDIERDDGGRIVGINGKKLAEYAEKAGLNRAEVSMAVRRRRLLNREKLAKLYMLGLPLELLVFGVDFYEKKREGNA